MAAILILLGSVILLSQIIYTVWWFSDGEPGDSFWIFVQIPKWLFDEIKSRNMDGSIKIMETPEGTYYAKKYSHSRSKKWLFYTKKYDSFAGISGFWGYSKEVAEKFASINDLMEAINPTEQKDDKTVGSL